MPLLWPPGTNFNEIFIEIHTYIFTEENAFENVVCKMADILSRHHCVKIAHKLSFINNGNIGECFQRTGQKRNDWYFANGMWMYFDATVFIFIFISLKVIIGVSIDNTPPLVYTVPWCQKCKKGHLLQHHIIISQIGRFFFIKLLITLGCGWESGSKGSMITKISQH